VDTLTDNFGLRLRSMIERKGITVDAFADQFGIARSTAHLWLNRAAPPLEKHWKPLADFFGVSEKYLAHGLPVAEEEPQAPYVISRENAVGGLSSGSARSGEMLNPRHKPVASPTGQDCLDYFTRYVQLAERVPGYVGHTWIELQRHFPIAELERQIDPPPDPPGKLP
jgi:transcriptional regulator with XRE-family HTH domain